jgi:tetratricopeptide (TPR) repeat protein
MSVPKASQAELDALMGRAAALAARGDWHGAQVACAAMLELAPDSAEVLGRCAATALAAGQYCDARQLTLRLAALPLERPELLLEAVRLLRRFEEPEQVLKLFQHGRWHSISSLPMLAELALHLGSCGRNAEALKIVDRMLAIDGGSPDALYLRGLFEMFLGHREQSLSSLSRAVSVEPRLANAHWLIAMQGDRQDAQAHVEQMQRVLPYLRPGSEASAYLLYSLHSRLHSLGRYHEAWNALEAGAAILRAATPYSRSEQHRLFEAIKKLELPAYDPPRKAADEPGLIFIVGMFRSGTTLIERVLTGHQDVADGGETYQLSACIRAAVKYDGQGVIDEHILDRSPDADFDQARKRMYAYARWRSGGRPWLTEKLPSNFLNVGFILHAFPEARILHLRRNPVDTCFSNLRTIFRGAAPYACDQSDMADYYLRYVDLMQHWHHRAPGRILDIDYADFVADPEGQTQRMMAYCGLPYEPEALNIERHGGQTATASAAHVRLGILKNRTDAWRPYASYLQPLLRGLEPLGVSVNG